MLREPRRPLVFMLSRPLAPLRTILQAPARLADCADLSPANRFLVGHPHRIRGGCCNKVRHPLFLGEWVRLMILLASFYRLQGPLHPSPRTTSAIRPRNIARLLLSFSRWLEAFVTAKHPNVLQFWINQGLVAPASPYQTRRHQRRYRSYRAN